MVDLGLVGAAVKIVVCSVFVVDVHLHPAPAMEPVVIVVAKSLSPVQRTSRAYARWRRQAYPAGQGCMGL